MAQPLLSTAVSPDWESLVRCILRKGAPQRVHHIELFLDPEVQAVLWDRFDLAQGLSPRDHFYRQQRLVTLNRFLGYDYVRCGLENLTWLFHRSSAADTAAIGREGGRSFMDEIAGPITSWEDFETYPWPDPAEGDTGSLEWYQNNLPDDMCIIAGGGFAHFAEHLTWLMGYQTLCYALFDARDLVQAISNKLVEIYSAILERLLQFDRVKLVWGSDDLGYRSGTLISPADTREFFLPGHRLMAQMCHAAGKPYLLHSCGKLTAIMEDLIDDIGIDGKHSFEDTVESVIASKAQYGNRIALLGGIDVDFLCRATEEQIRERVRRTLEACMPGGGYCLGTGNSVTNYIPIDSYLIMLDEGRRFAS